MKGKKAVCDFAMERTEKLYFERFCNEKDRKAILSGFCSMKDRKAIFCKNLLGEGQIS